MKFPLAGGCAEIPVAEGLLGATRLSLFGDIAVATGLMGHAAFDLLLTTALPSYLTRTRIRSAGTDQIPSPQ
jgi:hypothetical protein